MNDLITIEEHSEVLSIWQSLGLCNATVVCFDRHLDYKPVTTVPLGSITGCHRSIPFQDDNSSSYGLDDFLDLAGRLGLIRRVIWVCPSAPLERLWEHVTWIAGYSLQVNSTWQRLDHGAQVNLGNITVESTTLEGLKYLKGLRQAIVDVDLDYFCDEHGVLEVIPAIWLEEINKLNLGNRVVSLCFSERSGFIPAESRILAEALSSGLGRRLSHYSIRRPLAPRTMDLLAHRNDIEYKIELLIEEELASLGGPGWSLAAVAACELGELAKAEICYQKARESGDRARWAAFAIAHAYHRRKQYSESFKWSQLVDGPKADPLWAHSKTLSAVAALRLSRRGKTIEIAKNLCELIPLRPEPLGLLRLARSL